MIKCKHVTSNKRTEGAIPNVYSIGRVKQVFWQNKQQATAESIPYHAQFSRRTHPAYTFLTPQSSRADTELARRLHNFWSHQLVYCSVTLVPILILSPTGKLPSNRSPSSLTGIMQVAKIITLIWINLFSALQSFICPLGPPQLLNSPPSLLLHCAPAQPALGLKPALPSPSISPHN